MILYHGSPKAVEVSQYGFGSKENDYGLGFYCTQSNDLAKEWACPTLQSGFSNQYELNMDDLRVLCLNSEGYHMLQMNMQKLPFTSLGISVKIMLRVTPGNKQFIFRKTKCEVGLVKPSG